ncbi:MAG: hypothetical protein ACRCT8_17645 [Lacipirellulaceae bacterium]
MPANNVPSGAKSQLEKICRKAAEKVKKAAPGEKNEKKLAKLLNDEVCKEVDDKLLTLLAEEIAKYAQKASAKGDSSAPERVDAKPSLKQPGSGSKSLTLPLASIDLFGDKKKDGALELKIWGDPSDFTQKEKGAVLNFSVKF